MTLDEKWALRQGLTGCPVPMGMRPRFVVLGWARMNGRLTSAGRRRARLDDVQHVHPCCNCGGPLASRRLVPTHDELCPKCLILIRDKTPGSASGNDLWVPEHWGGG